MRRIWKWNWIYSSRIRNNQNGYGSEGDAMTELELLDRRREELTRKLQRVREQKRRIRIRLNELHEEAQRLLQQKNELKV